MARPAMALSYSRFSSTSQELILNTATISGLWGVDNIGTIRLNGNLTGNDLPFGFDVFEALHPFTVTGGFLPGFNELQFSVTDTGPPLGLRVENLIGSADPLAEAVPEPTTLSIMGAGLLLSGFFMRRRRRAARQ